MTTISPDTSERNASEKIRTLLRPWMPVIPRGAFPLYLVGGSVRDLFFKRGTSPDIDIVCKNPQALLRAAEEGGKHHIVKLGANKPKTTWRLIDKADKEKHLDLCAIEGKNIEEDLFKRDFTINALAWEISEEGSPLSLTAPHSGMRDIADRKLVPVSPTAFQDDPLRILRGFRFMGESGFSLHQDTLSAMRVSAPLLAEVSGERIRDELFTILNLPESRILIRRMDELRILDALFPEIPAMRACPQDRYHCLDVWSHTLLVYDVCDEISHHIQLFRDDADNRHAEEILSSGKNRALLKLAALLHDIAKPATRGKHPKKGHITFHGHDHAGAKRAEEVAERLHFSKEESKLLFQLVKEHLHVHTLLKPETGKKKVLSWLRRYGDNAFLMLLLEIADSQGANREFLPSPPPCPYSPGPALSLMEDYLRHHRKEFSISPLINGKDLQRIGFTPGKKMGKILQELHDAQYAGEISTKTEALRRAERMLIKG